MGGPPYDCMANPLGVVRLTFEKAIGLGSENLTHPSAFDGKDWGALELFRHFLFQESGLSQVPILNPKTLRWVQHNSLVRYRGMIQDMLGNEFYVGAYREDGSSWRTNKFTDVSQYPMESPSDTCIWERRLLYCAPVPGQSFWTVPSCDMDPNRSSQSREKRRRMNDEDDVPMDLASEEEVKSSPIAKKMRENGLPSASSEPMDLKTASTSSCMSTFQFVDKDDLPCLIKIYDSPESDLKLNDVFEFVGVLTFDSELAVEKDGNDELSNIFYDDARVHLPPNKVPRLHYLVHRKLAVHDFLLGAPIMEPKPHLVKEIREALFRHLTAVLGNDGVAAHFMLLHLLSKVHNRVDDVAVGKLSLNLTGLSKESVSVFGTRLSQTFKTLLPFTNCMPLALEHLNTASLAPKKDYQTNRLIPGALQLPEGSHLMVDETQLKSGSLNSIGIENVKLLKNLIEFQKVEYDFQFYKMEMAADVQLLIFSEGKSNIVPADVIVPFQPCSLESSELPTGEALEAWRWYLATVRSLPHSIGSEMQKVVEDDLVSARQADRSLGSRDFSRWLTMGRLISSSLGETNLALEHWQMVKEMERLRKERVK
ncbi:mini-chromosome maintenance complex-binding protein-like [Hibiscus syriacus]|uniref:mini-chromosome maintenance complex-binding protein-like n=1 Tax=Hibiscus syriacus TaxID=106335 RepID=UPI001920880A|nr:mini-chromosome maintenance complex-binding protein-like [Hibiscus syriacus]XP_039002479.1 mini-chromosome maintenance complex-binding protein-like [Hibiscus syriacus]